MPAIIVVCPVRQGTWRKTMNPDTRIVLRKMLSADEGRRSHFYLDSKGIPTIGVGRNISPTGPGLRESEIDFMLDNDIDYLFNVWINKYTWFKDISEARKCALIDFSFCGFGTVAKFEKMLYKLSIGDYDGAAIELLNSSYAKQVGKRADRLAAILRTGKLVF